MKFLTWQNPGQLFVAQDIKKVIDYSAAELRIYKEHDKLELKDLMDFRDNYSDGYLKELLQFLIDNKIDSSSLTREDVYRMIFGVEWNDDKHLDRPFGKMKNDILKEIIN